MSSSVLGATATAGAVGATAAAERMQQLQTLIAQVERGPASFAATLGAAQAGASSTQTTNAIGVGTGAAATAAATGAPAASGSLATAAAYTPSELYGTSAATTASYPAIDQGTTQSAVATTSNPAASAYVPLIEQAAARNGVDPAVLYGLIQQESGFDPSATSSAGAVGLTQLMPGTASSLGVSEPLNPAQSIEGGARYLGQMLRQFGGNTADALAAYNAGPGAVQQYGGVPPYPETQQYVSKVLANAAAYSPSVPATTAEAIA